ncbi:S8 family serine peptidase [Shewanella sp. WXL01]|uniref:S8 family peptidase n=1 Tax=Shewanella sp. WXL01 TaxID=2709721 RepID=UPI00143848D3|nr:S8 family peptidase [Shewanella sp. WXL01]NKF50881.1 S8 family serine peptidase [Shewanella sp. WXL01]
MKLSRINLVMGLAMSAMSANVIADDASPIHTVIPGKEKLKQVQNDKTRSDNLYFIRFNDEPLATYRGDIMGLAATQMSKGSNTTKAGTLDVKSAASVSYSRYLTNKQQTISSRLGKKLKRSLDIKHSYQIVLNAVAVELSAEEALLIANDADVASVEPVGMHQLHTSSGPEFIGAKQVWQGANGNLATQGEGVIVGIIDTGINATHPSFAAVGVDGYEHVNPLGEGQYLGDCQTFAKFCNDKLIGIVSYPEIVDNRPEIVGQGYADIEEKVQMGYDFNGHGSHVASTAAGNIVKDVNYYLAVEDEQGVISGPSGFVFDDISGVAPHANIVSYQVCTYNGACYPELAIRAVEHAITHGVNVLNYSVGGSARDPWSSADSVAFLNAREAGIHVATSAGNSGPNAQTIGSPGNSPWITTVAAYTHDRGFSEKQLSDFVGGDTTPAALTGKGATAAYTASVVNAADFGDGQCLTPFEAGTFDGEIVVCERGDIARVRKGKNVLDGGAGGLILINVAGGAESIDSDHHLLPAIHLSATDGQTLVDWLAAGEGHQATIGDSQLIKDPELGDIAGVFTSRGPNLPYPNIFAPDIAAPGVDIYAANAEDRPFTEAGGGTPYVTMSGTSMSSPHVAGALALIHASQPDWSPAQVQSAVMSTAHQMTYKDDEYSGTKQRSDFFDQGAGSIRIADAINAGLVLDISKQEYVDANPEDGGDPSALNSTSMVQSECVSSCTWTRTVTAVKASSWSASYEYLTPGFDLTVSPASFSLAAGESQELTITAAANIELADEWVHGYVKLTNADTSMSDTHLQATVGFKAGKLVEIMTAELNNVDNQVVIKDVTTSGTNDLQTKGFGFFPAVEYPGDAVASSTSDERESPWNNLDTIHSVGVVVKPYTKRLIAEITSSTAPDMDLYVGIDENGDGQPDAWEVYYSLLCISGQVDSNELCVIETPATGNYWIFAHNYQGSVDGESDDVTLRITQVAYTYNESFDIDAPTSVAQDEAFDVTLTVNGYLDDNEQLEVMQEGEVYYGLLELGTTANLKRNVGATLIKVEAKAPVQVTPNQAPVLANAIADAELELDDNGAATMTMDLTNVFSDPDGDALTLSVTGHDGASIDGTMLSLSVDAAATVTLTVTASDGELTVSESFDVVVSEAPAPADPTPEPEPTPSSDSGGALGYFAALLMLVAASRRRLLKVAMAS